MDEKEKDEPRPQRVQVTIFGEGEVRKANMLETRASCNHSFSFQVEEVTLTG